MRALLDVLNAAEGARWLESEGVLTDQGRFVSGLREPVCPRLAELVGAGTPLVYAAQQVSIDYRESVLAKLRALDGLAGETTLSRVFIWVDTDRSGAHAGPNSIRLMWPLGEREHPVRISAGAFDAVEPRFVPVDPAYLTSAIDQLGAYVSQSWLRKSPAARSRFEQLRTLFIEPAAAQTLSEFNHRVTCFVLEHHLGLRLRSVMLSDVINSGLITDQVNVFINHLDEIRLVFNQAVAELVERDIDPQVKALEDDYLPLHFSCMVDARRLRLRHLVEGRDHFAVSACRCGRTYRFHLGAQRLGIDALVETNRWSPDVCLLVFLNDLVSGVVVGKSSALYGVVLNRALRAMGKDPVAMVVPESLRQPAEPRRADSLLYDYLTAARA